MLFWIMVDVGGGAGRKESKSSAAAALETSFLLFEGWKEIFFFSVRTLSRYSGEKIDICFCFDTFHATFFKNPTEPMVYSKNAHNA